MLITDVIENYLNNNIPFVSYRLPFTTESVTLVGGSFSAGVKPDQNQTSQFIVAPFDTENVSMQVFAAENKITGWDIELPDVEIKKIPSFIVPEKPVITDVETYQLQAEMLIGAMKRHEFEKVVLSRVLEFQLTANPCLGKVYEKACNTYPNAFVYLLNDGKGQIWMGATPETLLQVSSGIGSTMSLAGTQSVDNQLVENLVWEEKERKEHQFVTDYIRDVLCSAPVDNIEVSETKSVQAGKMAHLQTDFSFQVLEKHRVLDIALALHPTPAVCGIPQQPSFRVINATEKHKRNYYTGFLGFRDENENCQFFVNLRCMQIIGNKAFIFVGGGLTAQSDPLKEWNETELKAGTMLSLFSE
jgi:isochorismate synthase